MASLARQNYHQDCEAAVNKQINLELHVSYVYLSIGYYFDRDDVALSGFQEFYIRSSDRERKRAEKVCVGVQWKRRGMKGRAERERETVGKGWE